MNLATVRRYVCLALLAWASGDPAAADERFIDAHGAAIEALLKERFAGSNAGMVIGLVDSAGTRVFWTMAPRRRWMATRSSRLVPAPRS